MEPRLITPPQLQSTLEALKPLEPLVYAANAGKTREYFDQLLAPEFWEVAASGRRYSRDYVLDALEARQKNPFEQAWKTTDYYVQQLADDLFLITYHLHQPTRVSARTSLWRKTDNGWLFIYHHGATVMPR